MSHLTNTIQAPATNPYTTRNFYPNKYKKNLPKILFPTHCHPLEQSISPSIKAAHSLQNIKHYLHSYYKAKLSTYIPP
jgi:hypothetical protein